MLLGFGIGIFLGMKKSDEVIAAGTALVTSAAMANVNDLVGRRRQIASDTCHGIARSAQWTRDAADAPASRQRQELPRVARGGGSSRLFLESAAAAGAVGAADLTQAPAVDPPRLVQPRHDRDPHPSAAPRRELPAFVFESIIHHEYLHHVLGPNHNRRFHADERKFRYYRESQEWIRRHLFLLLGRKRSELAPRRRPTPPPSIENTLEQLALF